MSHISPNIVCNGGYMVNVRARNRLMSLYFVVLYNGHPRYVNNRWTYVKTYDLTGHSKSGGIMSYWPLSPWHCTQHLLQWVNEWRPTDCLTQSGGIMSYWPLRILCTTYLCSEWVNEWRPTDFLKMSYVPPYKSHFLFFSQKVTRISYLLLLDLACKINMFYLE